MAKVQKQDLYHGAALTQIVEHPPFKALNRASKAYGHYRVNADREVFIKYNATSASPWQFTLQEAEVDALDKALRRSRKIFLCLVCGKTTVCALNGDEIEAVVEFEVPGQTWVRVQVPSGGSCHVTGAGGKLSRVIPHNAFPKKIFA